MIGDVLVERFLKVHSNKCRSSSSSLLALSVCVFVIYHIDSYSNVYRKLNDRLKEYNAKRTK
jgi:hypothetical protein